MAIGLELARAPGWLVIGAYAACYLAGGLQPARDGLAALRERRIDVDVLMVVAALAAAAIGQWRDGALLIVIFAVSGALEELATRRAQRSLRDLVALTPETAERLDADGTAATVVRAAGQPSVHAPDPPRRTPARSPSALSTLVFISDSVPAWRGTWCCSAEGSRARTALLRTRGLRCCASSCGGRPAASWCRRTAWGPAPRAGCW